jgi:hypothetical protein
MLKILFSGLLLVVLAWVVGSGVPALHHRAGQANAQAPGPVVVRKTTHPSGPPKKVQALPSRPVPRQQWSGLHKKAPAK